MLSDEYPDRPPSPFDTVFMLRLINCDRKVFQMARQNLPRLRSSEVEDYYLRVLVAYGRFSSGSPVDIVDRLDQCVQGPVDMRPLNWMRYVMTIPQTWVKREAKAMLDLHKAFQPYMRNMELVCQERRVYWSQHGTMAIVPRDTRVGDMIVIFTECPAPFIIRRQGGSFMLVGPVTFLHRYMDGEAQDSELWHDEEFCLR